MVEEVKLGQIRSATFGIGGYQDAQIGLWLTLGGKGWSVSQGYGAWNTDRTAGCDWTEADRLQELGRIVMMLNEMLVKTKKRDVSELVGIPVEVVFSNNRLKTWRILYEVLS